MAPVHKHGAQIVAPSVLAEPLALIQPADSVIHAAARVFIMRWIRAHRELRYMFMTYLRSRPSTRAPSPRDENTRGRGQMRGACVDGLDGRKLSRLHKHPPLHEHSPLLVAPTSSSRPYLWHAAAVALKLPSQELAVELLQLHCCGGGQAQHWVLAGERGKDAPEEGDELADGGGDGCVQDAADELRVVELVLAEAEAERDEREGRQRGDEALAQPLARGDREEQTRRHEAHQPLHQQRQPRLHSPKHAHSNIRYP